MTKTVVETYSDKRDGEQREDMEWGWKDCKEQSPVETYGESPVPYEGQRESSQVFQVSFEYERTR